MFAEPQFKADVSARLDQLLSGYLNNHRTALSPLACPPWRGEGPSRQPTDTTSTGPMAAQTAAWQIIHSNS